MDNYMGNKAVMWEWCSVGMLVFALLFTLLYSFGYTTDISNCDYLYYMHFVSDSKYDEQPMIAGTIALYKPIYTLIGHNYWMWQKLTWFINTLIVLVPYFTLLNRKQQRKYAFVAAYLLLVVQWRFGCEPYKPVYLCSTIMLTCFIKYVNNKRFIYIVVISLMLAVITHSRFSSLFIYPLLAVAFVALRNNKWHTLSIVVLPLLLFMCLITITNGSVDGYISDLASSIKKSAKGTHSIGYILYMEIQSSIHLLFYSCAIIIPSLFYAIWKIRKNKICFVLFVLGMLFATTMAFPRMVPPIWLPPLEIALGLTVGVLFLGWYDKHFSWQYLVVGTTVVVTSLFCSIGSDFGFTHGYFAACFLPYFVTQAHGIEPDTNKSIAGNNTVTTYKQINNGLFMRLFVVFVLIFTIAVLRNRLANAYDKYSEGNKLSIVDMGNFSSNMKHVYMGEESFALHASAQKEYDVLSKESDNVIFWGVSAHLMSFANDKWPITDVWDITSKDIKSKAFCDFKEYVTKNRPAVIDLERHDNTERLLLTLGYKKTEKTTYNVYTIR